MNSDSFRRRLEGVATLVTTCGEAAIEVCDWAGLRDCSPRLPESEVATAGVDRIDKLGRGCGELWRQLDTTTLVALRNVNLERPQISGTAWLFPVDTMVEGIAWESAKLWWTCYCALTGENRADFMRLGRKPDPPIEWSAAILPQQVIDLSLTLQCEPGVDYTTRLVDARAEVRCAIASFGGSGAGDDGDRQPEPANSKVKKRNRDIVKAFEIDKQPRQDVADRFNVYVADVSRIVSQYRKKGWWDPETPA